MIRNDEVVNAFYSHQKANSLHLSSTGNKLFSYYTIIAQRIDSLIIKNITKYSCTTSHHQGKIRNYNLIADDVPMGERDLTKYIKLIID